MKFAGKRVQAAMNDSRLNQAVSDYALMLQKHLARPSGRQPSTQNLSIQTLTNRAGTIPLGRDEVITYIEVNFLNNNQPIRWFRLEIYLKKKELWIACPQFLEPVSGGQPSMKRFSSLQEVVDLLEDKTRLTNIQRLTL